MAHSWVRVGGYAHSVPEPTRSILYFIAVYTVLALGWWDETLRGLSAPNTAGRPMVLPWLAAIALAARCVGWCVETGFYVWWWRAWGRRLPFGRCLRWIIVFSGFAMIPPFLARLALVSPEAAAWCAPFAGPGVFELHGSRLAMFGDAGLLTGTRIFLTADVQARALGIGRLRPFALCLGTWVATRAAILVLADLARGRSSWP